MKIQSFKFHEEGLNRFFGPLEAKIMDLIWSADGLTIKEVHEKLEAHPPLSFNTIMTVMNRLLEKGILEKNSEGRKSIYRAKETRETFLHEQTREVTEGLLHEFQDLTISHFVDLLDQVKPDLLKQLEAKLQQVKKNEV